jgi:hypothetical protein
MNINIKDAEYPLIVDVNGNERLVAELFLTENGIAWLDIGWTEASFHPAHYVDGKITGTNPWTVGEGVTVRNIKRHEEDQWDSWDGWLFYLSAHRDEASRENAYNFIKKEFRDVVIYK